MDKEKADMIIYTTEDGLTKVETTFDGDTVWLSIDQMAELFQRDKSTISRHIKNIFIEGELQRDSVVAKFATTEFPFFISFDFLLFICLYLRLAIISRHRHVNRIIISIDILQLLLLLFQPFDLPCGSGRGKAAQSLKVATG